VFVLRSQSISHLTCLVSFHQVTYHIQFIQSYKLHPYIRTFIQSYIHTLILSHIHIFMHTQYIHNIIHTWLHQSPKVLFGCILSVVPQSSLSQVPSPNKQTTCIYLYHMSSGKFEQMNSLQSLNFYFHKMCLNSPHCRMTEYQNVSFSGLSDYKISKVSSPVYLFKRCH
jgi:hypothetical protein